MSVPPSGDLIVDPADRPTGFGYHVIHSSPEKYDEMARWYQTLFGVHAKHASDGAITEQLVDPTVETIVIVERPDLPTSNVPLKTGVLHMAWFYNSLAELMYVCRRARDHGIKAAEVMATPVLLQVYFNDPEGNQVELGVDAHDTSEETQAAMRNAENIRAPGKLEQLKYDIDKVIKMVESGIPDQDIFRQETYHTLAASGRF